VRKKKEEKSPLQEEGRMNGSKSRQEPGERCVPFKKKENKEECVQKLLRRR
jgi:hypothetical protein